MKTPEHPQPSPGEQKIREYVGRIRSGESKESIIEGLPRSFVDGIEAGLMTDEEKVQAHEADQAELLKLKMELGIEKSDPHQDLRSLIDSVTTDRKQAVVDLYERLFANMDDPEDRRALASALFQDVYNRYRRADYPIDPNEEQVWEEYLRSTNIGVNNKKKEWMYRGDFSESGDETQTRGSFNVNVTPELISALDNLILSGKIRANYKFGQPGTSAAPTERHDSVSIYFLEEPTDEALQEIAETVKPYVRGDTLLGKKIADGFYMSEIGNVESGHVRTFVDSLQEKDPAFAKAVEQHTTQQAGRGNSLKMSEAQYYAIKDVAHAFGYEISYDKEKGFVIE